MKQKNILFAAMITLLALAGCSLKANFNDWNRNLDFQQQAKVHIHDGRFTLKELDGQATKGTGFWKSNGGLFGLWEKVLILSPGHHSMTVDLHTATGFAYNVRGIYNFNAGHLYEMSYLVNDGYATLTFIDVTDNPPPIWKKILADIQPK
jgi:hypothetical protein